MRIDRSPQYSVQSPGMAAQRITVAILALRIRVVITRGKRLIRIIDIWRIGVKVNSLIVGENLIGPIAGITVRFPQRRRQGRRCVACPRSSAHHLRCAVPKILLSPRGAMTSFPPMYAAGSHDSTQISVWSLGGM